MDNELLVGLAEIGHGIGAVLADGDEVVHGGEAAGHLAELVALGYGEQVLEHAVLLPGLVVLDKETLQRRLNLAVYGIGNAAYLGDAYTGHLSNSFRS